MSEEMDYRDLVQEFEWTMPRHGGFIQFAAPIFGISEKALDKRLRRARQHGFTVEFKTDGVG